jgi:hypothetical protein
VGAACRRLEKRRECLGGAHALARGNMGWCNFNAAQQRRGGSPKNRAAEIGMAHNIFLITTWGRVCVCVCVCVCVRGEGGDWECTFRGRGLGTDDRAQLTVWLPFHALSVVGVESQCFCVQRQGGAHALVRQYVSVQL